MAAAAPRRAADAWSERAAGNPVVTMVDTLLRGTGQVMFQNNPLTGLLFLAGIFVNSGKLGGLGILGLATSTLTAYLLGADRTLIRNGLFGFNGILVGIGLAFFLNYNGLLIGYVILGGALSTVAMMALANVFSVWDMPALTAPFVLTAWLLLFAVLLFANLRPGPLIAPAAPDVRMLPPTALREAATGAAAIISALVFAAIGVFLAPIGMPALTAPFVLVTWIFLLAKAGFKALVPVGLADVSTAEATLEGYRTGGAGPAPPARGSAP